MSTTLELPPPATSPEADVRPEPLRIMRLSVDQFHAMIEHDILSKLDRVELLRGLIVPKHTPLLEDGDPGYPTDADPLPLMRLSVERYHAMIEHGILGPGDRVELLRGLLVLKMPTNLPHTFVKNELITVLGSVLPSGLHIRSQDPIALAENEPEPDVAVVRGKNSDYRKRKPGPADLVLVVEVSDSSLSNDRNLKKSLYAENGIAVYWIVNIPERRIEVYSQPSEGVYRESLIYSEDESAPVIIDGQHVGSVRVADLMA